MEDGSSRDGASLRTRRMCVAVTGAGPGFLASALRSGEIDRMDVAGTSDGEVAVAPTGADEIWLARDLIAAVRQRLDSCREGSAPVFPALNVGLVRIVDGGPHADPRAEEEEIEAGM
ncbi:hypothetical protein [Catenulispora pinisilvae]|uniref:hypothetical protein n=1 Tax=Catenulispora pinisilvae TaxID=2705253 RepID=UPI0018914C70|nr:hypothetical protein [Catenulispora pinisilvae]